MMMELGNVFVNAVASQFGWLAVLLAGLPFCIVLATLKFWEKSDKKPEILARFSKFEKISSQRYLTQCSDTLQKFVGDPITSFRRFLWASVTIYFILYLFAFFIFRFFYTELNMSLTLPSKFNDIIEIFISLVVGYFVFIFCLSQSILFLDLCKSSRSSWQVFFALVADVLLTFAAVAIFTGLIDTSYTWWIYGNEKRNVSLKIVPLEKMVDEIFEGKQQKELLTPDERDMTSVIRDMGETSIAKKYPTLHASIIQKKSEELLKKEKTQFDDFLRFKGFEEPTDVIVMEPISKFDSLTAMSLEMPLTQVVGRMIDQQDICSPLLVQNSVITTSLIEKGSVTVYINANVTPNLNALDFARMMRDSVGRQLRIKWETIGSGFLDSDRDKILSDLGNSAIFTVSCAHYWQKAKPLDRYRDYIFIKAYYNELHSDRRAFWMYSIPSSYYAFSCYSTSAVLILVMIGLLIVNLYNLASKISSKIFLISLFNELSCDRRAYMNAIILGLSIFVAVGILRALMSFVFG
jgi:hypothetical protein